MAEKSGDKENNWMKFLYNKNSLHNIYFKLLQLKQKEMRMAVYTFQHLPGSSKVAHKLLSMVCSKTIFVTNNFLKLANLS